MATKAYTKAGDKGTTALFGGITVSKAHLRVSCYGTLDELNSWIGVIRAQRTMEKNQDQMMVHVQKNLFTLGALLANPKHAKGARDIEFDSQAEIAQLETFIDAINEKLPELKQFILPGGTKTASYLHIARTVTRRAERLVVALATEEEIDQGLIAYLNRLSSAFFVLARNTNFKSGVKEDSW